MRLSRQVTLGLAGAALAGAATFATATSSFAQPSGEADADSALVLPDFSTGAFTEWLAALRSDAAGRGVDEATLDAALVDLQPIRRVIELDRNQPEFTLTFDEYLTRVVPARRVAEGRALLAEHADLLAAVSRKYGVQPRVIVALWGVETNFGEHLGGFQVIPALVTLAYEGRRAEFFRRELLYALQILDEGHVTADSMTGSWAGAMGQCQFMPSSFVRHAVDFDGDGRRDIWGTLGDVFASAANYLASSGWNGQRIWGREVRLPDGFDDSALGQAVRKPLPVWQGLGVRRIDGRDLPAVPGVIASIIRPGGDTGPTYAVYDNFEAILKWNRSTYFATAVGVLSDRIGQR